MHDPDVVAFEVRRPWPTHVCRSDQCGQLPRFRPRRSALWEVAGHRWYFPPLVTVWHREPGGRDSGEVCRHWRPRTVVDGQVLTRDRDDSWRWHVRHWRVQVPPLQELRRTLLTRCEWCGGRSRRGDPVNCSSSWDRARGPWWRGERGLYHADCSTVESAHRTCTCLAPAGREFAERGYGTCEACGLFRAWRQKPRWTWLARELRLSILRGRRDRHRYELAVAEAGRRFPADEDVLRSQT